MTALESFLWVGLPYLSFGTFIIGMIWRYRYDQYGWTTRSSQSYESVWLRIASPLFHFGIIFVFIGHIIGLLIPKSWTEGSGISETTYHFVATYPGTLAGVATIVGLILLIIRRRTYGDVFRATTPGDKLMYVLLFLPIALGIFATIQNQLLGGTHGYEYRETISPWLRSIFTFNPKPDLMVDVPLSFQLHTIAAFLLFMIWPFTRLVHAFSAPVGYVARPDIIYRHRTAAPSTQRAKRGWEPINYAAPARSYWKKPNSAPRAKTSRR